MKEVRTMLALLVGLVAIAGQALAQTAVPNPTAPLNATLPSQAPLPPSQAWCPSKIFCAGPLLQTINIAQLYPDSKTFVDKPTVGTPNKTLADFNALLLAGNAVSNTSALTYGSLIGYVEADFAGEGLELIPESLGSSLPTFLQGNKTVPDPLVRSWATIVHGYWSSLIRQTNHSVLCDGVKCESTLIPLNHTFVVPGGRFREQYYWDSYWIIEGLIQSELYSIANSTLQNFMDELATIGFIPNGGRIYYLNRSQPPLFMKMLYAYVTATMDVAILDRALPLAEVELAWWHKNRSLTVTSPYTGQTHQVLRYAVVNTAPRPEGYLPDYITANGPDIQVPLTEAEKENLYAELASGAESGHDYSSRFIKNPYVGNATNRNPALRELNVRGTIPVDLNSILYKYHCLVADLYDLRAHTKKHELTDAAARDKKLAARHRHMAASIKSAILDLFWDPDRVSFYDYNLTASARGTFYSPAAFWPFWNDIIPGDVLVDENKAMQAFSALRMTLARYNGSFPASFLVTGLQWDAPNAWPPHQFIAVEALQRLPKNLTQKALPTLSSSVTSFSLIPPGQLGLNESQLPLQPLLTAGYAAGDVNEISSDDGGLTVLNGGNGTAGEGWAHVLSRELVNRYASGLFCSWYATGGSIPGLLQQLPLSVLNSTNSLNNTGNMFEKLSTFNIDTAGSGGEYTVQAGFGWSNGVLLWFVSKYGKTINAPNCPPITIAPSSTSSTNTKRMGAFPGKERGGAHVPVLPHDPRAGPRPWAWL